MSYYGIENLDPKNLQRKIRPDPDYSFGELLLGFFVLGLAVVGIVLFFDWFIGIL